MGIYTLVGIIFIVYNLGQDSWKTTKVFSSKGIGHFLQDRRSVVSMALTGTDIFQLGFPKWL